MTASLVNLARKMDGGKFTAGKSQTSSVDCEYVNCK